MKSNFAFSRINFILLAISMAVVIVGYLLMSGSGSDHEHFDAAIFDFRHTTLAPIVCFFGYLMMIGAILYRPKTQEGEDKKEEALDEIKNVEADIKSIEADTKSVEAEVKSSKKGNKKQK